MKAVVLLVEDDAEVEAPEDAHVATVTLQTHEHIRIALLRAAMALETPRRT